MSRKTAALLALFLTAACASVERDPWQEAGRDAPPGVVVGWVDKQPVTYGEVAAYLRTLDPTTFARLVNDVVADRLVRREAAEKGIRAPEGLLVRGTARELALFEENLKKNHEKGKEPASSLDAWLESVALTREQWRTCIRRHVETRLLAERALRYEELTTPTRTVSVCTAASEAEAKDLARRARAGTAFASLIRQETKKGEPPAGAVGVPMMRQDFDDGTVAHDLFAAEAGDVVGPFASKSGKKTLFQVYRVDSVEPVRKGSYADLKDAVARSLADRPVTMREYQRWRLRLFQRHELVPAESPGGTG